MLESYEHTWEAKNILVSTDVYTDQLIHTHKLKDVITTLKNKSLSQVTLERYFVTS